MFTSTWWVITPLLLFVLSTFLNAIGLSNFCSLNPCLAAIFLSINISVALLSKSAFTVTPLCVSNFFTPIFNYTSLNILKVLLTSLWLPLSFAMPFDSPGHVLLCYAFPSMGILFSSCSSFDIYTISLCLRLLPALYFSFTWYPFSPYLSYCTYVTIISFIYHPSSNRHTSSGMPSSQCSCAFCHKTLLCYKWIFHRR